MKTAESYIPFNRQIRNQYEAQDSSQPHEPCENDRVVKDGLEVWDRIDVSNWEQSRVEAAGLSGAVWLEPPGGRSKEEWLHKSIHIPSNQVPQGEDWAEVVTTQVGNRLGVPCAETRLCLRDGVHGSLSRSVIPDGMDLYDGGVILEDAKVPGYFQNRNGGKACDPERPGIKRPGHSLANIKHVLLQVHPPESFQGPNGCTGFDVFAGFLILDALVANQDRHEQNWAVLRYRLQKAGDDQVAPSFDHGGSLGYNLPDVRREELAANPEKLATWAKNGRAQRFEHSGKPDSLVDHAAKAISMGSDVAVGWWKSQLRRLDLSPLQEVLRSGAVSGMSQEAGKFASELLNHNLGRLRDAICVSA